MKVLLAIDGSTQSDLVVAAAVARSVMAAAPCSVELARTKACSDATENPARSE